MTLRTVRHRTPGPPARREPGRSGGEHAACRRSRPGRPARSANAVGPRSKRWRTATRTCTDCAGNSRVSGALVGTALSRPASGKTDERAHAASARGSNARLRCATTSAHRPRSEVLVRARRRCVERCRLASTCARSAGWILERAGEYRSHAPGSRARSAALVVSPPRARHRSARRCGGCRAARVAGRARQRHEATTRPSAPRARRPSARRRPPADRARVADRSRVRTSPSPIARQEADRTAWIDFERDGHHRRRDGDRLEHRPQVHRPEPCLHIKLIGDFPNVAHGGLADAAREHRVTRGPHGARAR